MSKESHLSFESLGKDFSMKKDLVRDPFQRRPIRLPIVFHRAMQRYAWETRMLYAKNLDVANGVKSLVNENKL